MRVTYDYTSDFASIALTFPYPMVSGVPVTVSWYNPATQLFVTATTNDWDGQFRCYVDVPAGMPIYGVPWCLHVDNAPLVSEAGGYPNGPLEFYTRLVAAPRLLTIALVRATGIVAMYFDQDVTPVGDAAHRIVAFDPGGVVAPVTGNAVALAPGRTVSVTLNCALPVNAALSRFFIVESLVYANGTLLGNESESGIL